MPSEEGHIGPLSDGTSGVFVTGTGTEVGKTVVAAAIARTLHATGRRVAVFKPVVTGLEGFAPGGPVEGPAIGPADRSPADMDGRAGGPVAGLPPRVAGREAARRPDHEALRVAAKSAQSDEEIAPYRYRPPMSPHLAAELAGETIDQARLLRAARTAADRADALVCEGVGGLMVPLAPGYLVRDFAVELGLPIVVAAPPSLGTINHTLLTLEAARAAGLEVAAVVLTPWPQGPRRIECSNRETIAALGEVRVDVLPHLDLAAPKTWPELGWVSLGP